MFRPREGLDVSFPSSWLTLTSARGRQHRYNRRTVATMVYPSSRARSERAIAVARVVLAITASFTFWLEPAQTAPDAQFIYGLYSVYAVYALVLLVWSLWGEIGGHWPIVTHAVDVVLFSTFQYLTLGSTSPFFVFSLFSVFCGALRWGWKGTLATGAHSIG